MSKKIIDTGCVANTCIGRIEIEKIVENKDGSATVYFKNLPDSVKQFVKKYYGKKRFSKKIFRQFIFEGLSNYIKKDLKNELQIGGA